MSSASKRILIAGATGYLGSHLAPLLLARGHEVVALVRPESIDRVPQGCEIVFGDACEAIAYAQAAQGCDTIIHLVGVSHPSPAKASLFERVDLASARAAAYAAFKAQAKHVLYVSVAHPAPVMHAYIAARIEAESIFWATGVPLSIFRPWYVIGPGHRWPLLLMPLYKLAERFPRTRGAARRLGLVRLEAMLQSMLHAVEHPPHNIQTWNVEAIRRAQPARKIPVSNNLPTASALGEA